MYKIRGITWVLMGSIVAIIWAFCGAKVATVTFFALLILLLILIGIINFE